MLADAYCTCLQNVLGSYYSRIKNRTVPLYLARRNGGVQEPEHKLWLLSASLIIMPSALILWGVGAYHDVHWIGLLFGMGMLGVTNAIGATAAINYCVDSYKDLSGEAMITVVLIRNSMGFAIGCCCASPCSSSPASSTASRSSCSTS
jgi:hypothetical protein